MSSFAYGSRTARTIVCLAVWLVAAGCATGAFSAPRTLTIDERVSYQRAIEEVFWRHRIWPSENQTPKPPLGEVMPEAALRTKVEDYLKQSAALEAYWQRPVSAAQLQAEIDRMARDSHDPAMLAELFHALGDDPYVIAETLARQTLSGRLVRDWFSHDSRFQGPSKQRALDARAACASVECMEAMGGTYQETVIARGEALTTWTDARTVHLDDAEWRVSRESLERALGSTQGAIPLRRLTSVQETDDQYAVTAVLSDDGGKMTTATVSWPKVSFDDWWAGRKKDLVSDLAATAGPFVMPSVPDAACSANTWRSLPVTAPDARSEHNAVWTGSEMVVWGGDDFLNTHQSGGRYNPATDTWTPTGAGAGLPRQRRRATAVWTGSEMIVWGGDAEPRMDDPSFPVYLNTGGRYNPATDSWTPTSMGVAVPSARHFHTAIWTGTKMIVFGGKSVSDFDGGAQYDPLTDGWSVIANSGSPRSRHTAVWTGTEMIVWGGISGSARLSSGARYNPASNTWSATSQTLGVPTPRINHTAVWTGTFMIIWGGDSGTYENTGGKYSPATNSWIATSTGAGVPAGRWVHTAVWTGSRMIVWGGTTSAGLTNTGGIYDPAAGVDSWSPTSIGANVPEARDAHTAVWTGTEMIVWGGAPANTFASNTGGRYNPTTDTWVPTTLGASAPPARSGHVSVWTGTEMLSWGGGPGYMNTGGRYVPATDIWTPTSTGAGVPSERWSHVAVWTGSKMVVWGGFGGMSGLSTGGRYDPANDSWSPTSTVNAPPGSYSLAAIWTGTEMIVWGGDTGQNTVRNTGGRYNPVSDTWIATSTTNSPSARYAHTAVWTGSRMIVWGGGDYGSGSNGVNTGGQYDPATNSWTATSIVGAPVARGAHFAAWSGSRMVIWGGGNGSSLNSGGRYNPLTDAWSPTAITAGTPESRGYGSTVWTGNEMVVWGGDYLAPEGVIGFLNTGARYDPLNDVWTPISLGANVPSPRDNHTAVWTGSSMIVWGGRPTTASGASYCLYCTPDCDDHNSCTDDACGVDGCTHVPNTAACDDGNPCTVLDHCGGGSCQPGVPPTPVHLCNTTPITFNFGGVSPYPSTIAVSGLPPYTCGVTVDVNGVSLTSPNLDSVMVDEGPSHATILMSDAGGGLPTSNVNLTFSDAATSLVPNGPIVSGTYLPTDYDRGNDNFPGAPFPTSTNLATFNGISPNATWSLWATTTGFLETGSINGGWCVNIAAACPFAPPPEATGLMFAGDKTTLSWNGVGPGSGTYTIARGAVRTPPGAGVETCIPTALTTYSDATIPVVGNGFWYLVRISNACSGPWGNKSDGTPRVTNCP